MQLAKEAAVAQGDAGATMFIGCGQGPTFGQIEAANESGGVSMGYIGDMSGLRAVGARLVHLEPRKPSSS